MSGKQTITQNTDTPSGMTLAELAKFVDDAQARQVDPATRIKVRATFGGGIKSLTITSPT